MKYYNEIKEKILDNEIYAKVRDYSKERHKVITYFETGKLLYQAGNKYGESVIQKYSDKLMVEVGKKYNERTLRSMRQFYVTFNDDFWKPVVSKLSWTNFLIIMPLKEKNKMFYYINQCITFNLSKRQLQEKIKNKEYERLDEETKNNLIQQKETKGTDFVKNSILIKNNLEHNHITEKTLKQLLLEDLDNFIRELGNDFSYVGNEYKIKLGDRYNYIDLLFYNIKYTCYTVIELKVTELKKEHIGQIKMYMNYIDKNLKSIHQNKTIGIIICKKDNHFVMEYCSDERILTREYKFI